MRCLLAGIWLLLQKVKDMRAQAGSDEFEDPENLFNKIIEICKKDYNQYFDGNKEEFASYARVLGLVTNLFEDEKFPPKNLQYGFVSFSRKYRNIN